MPFISVKRPSLNSGKYDPRVSKFMKAGRVNFSATSCESVNVQWLKTISSDSSRTAHPICDKGIWVEWDISDEFNGA